MRSAKQHALPQQLQYWEGNKWNECMIINQDMRTVIFGVRLWDWQPTRRVAHARSGYLVPPSGSRNTTRKPLE